MNKPIRPVLDVSLLGIYLLFFGQTTIKKLVTLGSCLFFLVRLGNISFLGPGQTSRDSQLLFSLSELTSG